MQTSNKLILVKQIIATEYGSRRSPNRKRENELQKIEQHQPQSTEEQRKKRETLNMEQLKLDNVHLFGCILLSSHLNLSNVQYSVGSNEMMMCVIN